jgi:branched-subunit amino acid transport protein
MIPERELPLPNWLKRGLKYAPLAALAAVIAPEIVMSNGQLINSLADARLPALAASVVYFLQAQHSWHHCSGHGDLSAAAYRSGLVASRENRSCVLLFSYELSIKGLKPSYRARKMLLFLSRVSV